MIDLDFEGDKWREDMLQQLFLRFQTASTPEERHELWNVIKILHRGRSAARVRQMEKDRGLG